ncbi:hypothetical protein ACTL7R_01910 [Priestia aryabhattai]|uniref:hypothetical protein n=1 Tax=Priestia TaxID=2800373 RepID=UPI003F8C934B
MADINVFLCDDVQETNNGNFDVLGTNRGRYITIPELQYKTPEEYFKLERIVVLNLDLEESEKQLFIGKNVELNYTIHFSHENKTYTYEKKISQFKIRSEDLQNDDQYTQYLFSLVTEETALRVRDNSTLTINIGIEKLYKKSLVFEIKSDAAVTAYSNSQYAIPQAGVLGYKESPLTTFIGNSLDEIMFVDQYLEPDNLIEILKDLKDTNYPIKVLTNIKSKSKYQIPNIKLMAYKNLEVKYDDTIHDRFLILGSDVYAFGYSFKDLDNEQKRRYSYFSKIRAKKEHEEIMEIIKDIWDDAAE